MNANNNLQDSKRSKVRQIKQQEAEKLYEDNAFIVIYPKTEAASCLYGKGTQWCTAAKKDNRFDTFNSQGKLYIVIDKIDHRKYQFHFESQSYMDDDNIPLTEESSIFRYFSTGLKKFFKSMANDFSSNKIASYREMKSFYYLWANYLEMEAFYEKCIELDPDNAIDYILDMENYYFTNGKIQEAIDWCCRFLNLEISGIEMLYGNLGGHYLEIEQESKAMECYNKGLELSPDDKLQCLEGIGNVLAFYQNKHSEALTYFLEIEKLYPGEGSYYNMAICYEVLGDYDDALFYYYRSIYQFDDIIVYNDIMAKIEEISKKVIIYPIPDCPF